MGRIYAVGYTNIAGQVTDIWIRRYSSSGAKVWTRTVNGSANASDAASGVAVDPKGRIYVVGEISNGTGQDIWIRKYRPNGDKLWTRTVDGPAGGWDGAWGVAVDDKGRVYVVGFTEVGGEGRNVWVRRYRPDGGKLWTKSFNGATSKDDGAYGAAVDSKGRIIVVGYTTAAGLQQNAWVRKYKPNGDKLWTRTFDGVDNGHDMAMGVAVGEKDAIYVVGGTEVQGQDFDIWIRKYRASGTPGWTRTVNGPADGFDAAEGVATDSSGGVYVVGFITTTGESENIWARKYND